MVDPPSGNDQIVVIQDGRQYPLDMMERAYKMAFEL
jgi:hypothetical protein